jgi:dihydrofolate reductase
VRNVVVSEFVTMDGVMEDPGGAEGFEHGGWSFQFSSDEAQKYKYDELFAADALVLGRVTYQGFAAVWPNVTDEQGFAERMNGLPKYVASTTLHDLDWNNSTLIEGDVAKAVAELKQQPGQDILVAGSRTLVQYLLEHDLVDEIRLMVSPIVLGTGKRIFGEGLGKKVFKPVDMQTFASGIVVLTYAPLR